MKDSHNDSGPIRAAAPRGKRWLVLAALFVANVIVIVVMLPVFCWLVEAIWEPGQLVARAWKAVQNVAAGGLTTLGQALPELGRWIFSMWHDVFRDEIGGYLTIAAIAVLAAAPAALIAPLVGPPAVATAGRSMRASVIGAALLASALTCFVLVSLVELWYLGTTNAKTTVAQTSLSVHPAFALLQEPVGWCALWLLLGVVWAFLLRAAGRTRDPNAVLRLFRWLLAGTALELALGVSTLAWARKRDDCLCAWSSFWATVFGLTTLLLLCGPAVALLLTRRARLQWARLACRHCGYPRRTDSQVCSECGGALSAR